MPHECGISCNRASAACDECVPGFCTHRPSLVSIGDAARWRAGAPANLRAVVLRETKSRNKVSERAERASVSWKASAERELSDNGQEAERASCSTYWLLLTAEENR